MNPGPRREGASASRARFADRYRAWRDHHQLSAADSLRRLLENPASSLLTWLVIGIALALPAALAVALDNARNISGSWDSPAQLSLFLGHPVTLEEATGLRDTLAGRGDVASAALVSREEALAEFARQSGFADVLDSLEQNPLPHLLLVTPASGVPAAALQAELQVLSEVDEAVLDMAWVQRLNNIMALGWRLVLALGGLLVLGVVLILGNTIRLAIESRRDEIVIVKLVGGSNAFVRRPFLYTGLWYGVGGGVFAALLVLLALAFLDAPVRNLARLYQSSFELTGIGVIGSFQLVLMGGALGLAGAWLAVSRHLGAIAPR